MDKKKCSIPVSQLESLARVLLPIFQEYLSSEQGKKDYAEYKANLEKPNDKKSA